MTPSKWFLESLRGASAPPDRHRIVRASTEPEIAEETEVTDSASLTLTGQ